MLSIFGLLYTLERQICNWVMEQSQGTHIDEPLTEVDAGNSKEPEPTWLDITQNLVRTCEGIVVIFVQIILRMICSEMELGQMLFRENFGLFEAMSALEVCICESGAF